MKPVFVKRTEVCVVLGVHRHALERLVEAGAIREAPRLKRYVYRSDVEETFQMKWPEKGERVAG